MQRLVTGRTACEETAAPCGQQRVHGLFAALGAGRFEDPQHPVRERVPGERGRAPVFGHRRRDAVVVAYLQAE